MAPFVDSEDATGSGQQPLHPRCSNEREKERITTLGHVTILTSEQRERWVCGSKSYECEERDDLNRKAFIEAHKQMIPSLASKGERLETWNACPDRPALLDRLGTLEAF